MALINIMADFDRLIIVLERIDIHLQHGVRILESAFPLQPAAQWGKPADEMHVVGDAELLEREEEEARHKQTPADAESETLDDTYDPWDLDTPHR